MNATLRFPFLHKPGNVEVSTTVPDPNNQVYHHKDTKGVYRHFHINTLQALAIRAPCPIIRMAVTPEQLQYVRIYNGIEENRIRTMPAAQIDKLGLLCRFRDDTQLIADGSHRFVWRGEHGYDWMDFYDVPESIWRMSLLKVPPSISPYLLGQ